VQWLLLSILNSHVRCEVGVFCAVSVSWCVKCWRFASWALRFEVSLELLMLYLQGQKQWLLLSILNSHVRFELMA
jgi:hypothetical protein